MSREWGGASIGIGHFVKDEHFDAHRGYEQKGIIGLSTYHGYTQA